MHEAWPYINAALAIVLGLIALVYGNDKRALEKTLGDLAKAIEDLRKGTLDDLQKRVHALELNAASNGVHQDTSAQHLAEVRSEIVRVIEHVNRFGTSIAEIRGNVQTMVRRTSPPVGMDAVDDPGPAPRLPSMRGRMPSRPGGG